jgi:branched-chain amino acid transport system ATP-binding protein
LLLSTRDLRSGYGSAQILNGISLDVAEGEIVSLLGPNGAGKTTLLRTVSGLLKATSGSIEFDGARLNRLAPEARAMAGLGHVPEGRGILTTLTVGENLNLGLGLRRDGKSTVKRDRDAVLEIFEPLRHRLHEPAGGLSGGQQQMLALARALLARPRLLMVDELSFGLAPMLVSDLLAQVSRLREQGSTFLLVEQDAGALRISDRTYVLSAGRIVLESTSKELVGSDRLVRSYLGVNPASDSRES